MILCILGYVVIHSFKFVKDILDRLHEHRLQYSGECIGIIEVVFLQGASRLMRNLLGSSLLSGLALGNKLCD